MSNLSKFGYSYCVLATLILNFRALLEQVLSNVETTDTNLNLASHGFSPLIIRAIVDIVAEILTPKDSNNL